MRVDLQRRAFVAMAVAAAAVATLTTPSGGGLLVGGAVAAAPPGVVAGCSMRSGAQFPGAFRSRKNLRVGPLVLVDAAARAVFDDSFGGNKFPVLVLAGHRVTIALSKQTRKFAGLAYGPLPEGFVHVRDAHRVVKFVACPRGKPSGSSADGRSVTFWSGGILARGPHCVPLLIWADDARSPRRVVVRLGVRRCA